VADGSTPLATIAIGRKTPRDGKLEIPPEAAHRLDSLGAGPLRVTIAGAGAARGHADALVSVMACTCEKGRSGGPHEHHFLESAAFRELEPGRTARLALVGDRELELTLETLDPNGRPMT